MARLLLLDEDAAFREDLAEALALEGFLLDHLTELRAAAGPSPIMLVTAYGEPAHWDAAELGVTAIIPKPFTLDEFLVTIRTLLESSHA